MSACILIASDTPLPEFTPSRDYHVTIDLDHGVMHDGGADDNYSLISFPDAGRYTGRQYGVCLEWNYTDGRAGQIVNYIKNVLRDADCVELWHLWLLDYWEYEDRPFVHRTMVAADQLTPEHIRKLKDAVIWNTPDKRYPERPSFYCLAVTGSGSDDRRLPGEQPPCVAGPGL